MRGMALRRGGRDATCDDCSVGERLLRDFLAAMPHTDRRLLMLDFDGTLSPLTPARERAIPYAGVSTRLTNLLDQSSTRVVVISGRSASEAHGLLGSHPALEVWGVHGLEHRLPSGRVERAPVRAEAAEALAAAVRWAQARGFGDQVEEKYGAVALHWRALSSEQAAIVRISASDAWSSLAEQAGSELKAFDGGLELRAPGPNKGDVVRRVMTESLGADGGLTSMTGGGKDGASLAVAYLGDDLTDEDAFHSLRVGGYVSPGLLTLAVLVRPEWRPTKAQLWLRPPMELLSFLDRWVAADRPKEKSA